MLNNPQYLHSQALLMQCIEKNIDSIEELKAFSYFAIDENTLGVEIDWFNFQLNIMWGRTKPDM